MNDKENNTTTTTQVQPSTPVDGNKDVRKSAGKKSMNFSTKSLVLFAMFTALIILFGVSIGTIMIGPVGITLMHIPVIIGAIVLGWKAGALLGFIMGLVSFLIATFVPFVGAFAFSPFIAVPGTTSGNALALVVCFVPRILIGIISGLLFKLLKKKVFSQNMAWGFSALVGTLVNTIFVLGFIFLFFKSEYSSAMGIASNALLGAMLTTVFTNGIPEAALAFLVSLGVGSAYAASERHKNTMISDATQVIAQRNNMLQSENEQLRQHADNLIAENERLRAEAAKAAAAAEPVAVSEPTVEAQPEAESSDDTAPESTDVSADESSEAKE